MKGNRAIVTLLPSILQLNFVNARALSAENTHLAIDASCLIQINGVEQSIEIKAASKGKSDTIIIQGGPGWPATAMLRKYNADLANDFV